MNFWPRGLALEKHQFNKCRNTINYAAEVNTHNWIILQGNPKINIKKIRAQI